MDLLKTFDAVNQKLLILVETFNLSFSKFYKLADYLMPS